MLYRRMIEMHLDEPGDVLSDGIHYYTYRRLHEHIAEIRACFKKRGLRTGSRVAITAHNCIETIITVLACIADGYIFVLLYPDMAEEERERIKRDCAPELELDRWKGLLGETAIRAEDRRQLPEDTLTSILYTSGSDGRPKGVTASQKQILFCCDAINRRLANTGRDRILCCLPLAFDYGLYQVYLALLNHSLLYISEGRILQKIPRMLSEWRITAFPVIPSVMNLLMRTSLLKGLSLPELRYITFTGEYLSAELIDTLITAYPNTEIVPMYGLTECKRVAITPFGRDDKKRQGSCGLPLDGIHVRLRDKDPETGIGELVVSGPNVMEGYWGELGQNGTVYAADELTGERCVYTGDLFRMDDEGFLYFCGRKSRIIKVKGYRVSAASVEAILEKLNISGELAVIGVEDRCCGEKIGIFVSTDDEKIDEKIRELFKNQPEYMRNYRLFLQTEPFPRTNNGKIDELELKKRVIKNAG